MPEEKKHYVYVMVRTDIPLSQQLVQSTHAVLESGLRSGKVGDYPNPISIVLLQARDESHLLAEHARLAEAGLVGSLFYEPDDMGYPPGYTALASPPLHEKTHRKAFRGLPLWNYQASA